MVLEYFGRQPEFIDCVDFTPLIEPIQTSSLLTNTDFSSYCQAPRPSRLQPQLLNSEQNQTEDLLMLESSLQNNRTACKKKLPYVLELEPIYCFSAFSNSDSSVNSSVNIVNSCGGDGDIVNVKTMKNFAYCHSCRHNINTNNVLTCSNVKCNAKPENAVLLLRNNLSLEEENYFARNRFIDNFCKRVFNEKSHDTINNKELKMTPCCSTDVSYSSHKKHVDLCCQYVTSLVFNNEVTDIYEKKKVSLTEFNRCVGKKLFLRNKKLNRIFFYKQNKMRKRYLQRRLAQVFCILGVFDMLYFSYCLFYCIMFLKFFY